MSKKKKLSILLLILLLLGLLTAAVLASRLGNLNKKKDDGNTISIGDDSQKVSSDTEDDDAPLEANLMIYKDAKIFCTSYDDGRVTVLSADDDKVIAPGTKRNYKFTLYNSKNASLDYKLYVTATVEGLDNPNLLPVQARLKGPDKWVTGNYGNYIPVLDVNKAVDEGVLAGGNTATYVFGWQWLFEGNDELDTMLGNMALEEPIILKINIRVYAWNDEIPDKPGGEKPDSPPTGDDFNIGFWMSAMIISLFAFVAVLARDRKERSYVQEILSQGANEDQNQRE